MGDQFLKNSLDRLRWVEKTADRPTAEIRLLESHLSRPLVRREVKMVPETGMTHARWQTVVPDIDPDLTFVIANIAVDLRSCLDMALQEICDSYSIPVSRPQFPIEEPKPGSSPVLSPLRPYLPHAFVQVLEHLQPTYESPLGFYIDTPINQTLLWIRDIANANKHRRLTPITVRPRIIGVAGSQGCARVLDQKDSAWSDHEAASVEVAFSPGEFSESRLMGIKPVICLSMFITDSSHSIVNPSVGRIPQEVPLYEFLSQGPRYVKFALRCLTQAHTYSSEPVADRPFTHDFDFSF